jgi:hypothetical protein
MSPITTNLAAPMHWCAHVGFVEQKAKRFRQRAEDCTKLAELTRSDKMRWQYKRIAESYLAMACVELTRAEEIARNTRYVTIRFAAASKGSTPNQFHFIRMVGTRPCWRAG